MGTHADRGLPRPYVGLMTEITEKMQAAAFRTLVAHLQDRTDVQNIDLMNLSGFLPQLLIKISGGG